MVIIKNYSFLITCHFTPILYFISLFQNIIKLNLFIRYLEIWQLWKVGFDVLSESKKYKYLSIIDTIRPTEEHC